MRLIDKRSSKGLFHAVCYLFQNVSWHQLNFKNTCPFLLLKTIFRH